MKPQNLILNYKNKKLSFSLVNVHTLVLGSGAAGLNAAIRLNANGINDICIVTEGLNMGTSINTGSDKQTYYKLGMYGSQDDSPISLAKSFFDNGSMHGDLALIEASLSARAFLNLVNLGVKFPQDRYGQFVGYKTDHDPRQRATSCGPYTSKEMCRVLIEEVKKRNIKYYEKRVAVSLLTIDHKNQKRAAGIIAINLEKKELKNALEIFLADNVIFATGGPGGLYKTSVYPKVHTGGIGIALMAGAKAQNLPESQFGLASIKFRWNVSGTYMQVIPRFISTAADGKSDPREFLRPYFSSAGEMNSMVFLKGYQWPFDSRKVCGGSSIIDLLVYIETVVKGRRVFLDYTKNPEGFEFKELSNEAYEYLKKSEALLETPIKRLEKMNKPAIDLYKEHNIDITKEPLEIAVCAQHNNGGLAGNIWWESVNIKHLFPVGEVNGSHGVYRPGGSALNSGQVGGFRAAEFIANAYKKQDLNKNSAIFEAKKSLNFILDWLQKGNSSNILWQKEQEEFQTRMSSYGAHIRSLDMLEKAVDDAKKQYIKIFTNGCKNKSVKDAAESLRNLSLCFAHVAYLDAIKFACESGVGSRGSMIVLDKNGKKVHPSLGEEWNIAEQNTDFLDKVLETDIVDAENARFEHKWVQRRPIPKEDAWFETAWHSYRTGEIYKF
jgi:succinate dehydrogenase/fumarate reductase flavoprotein subunit